MANYDIDKITLPNGDVCNLVNIGGTKNYLLNSWPRNFPVNWAPGTIGENNDTGSSLTRNNGYLSFTCSSFVSGITSSVSFFSTYNNQQLEEVINCDWTSFNDGDPFTLSVEVKSTSDFYVDMCPVARQTSGANAIRPWGRQERNVLIPGDNQWHRIWLSGVIPDGFSDVAHSSSAYLAGVVFYFQYTTTQTILARKFMLAKGLNRTDWVGGDLDTPAGVFYYDDTVGTSYTIGNNNYSAVTKPTVFDLTTHKIVGVALLDWTTNSGPFWVAPWGGANTNFSAYVIGTAGTTVNDLKLRWFYTFPRVLDNV